MARREEIQQELEIVKTSLKSFDKPYVRDLHLEDEELSFTFDSYQGKTEHFTLHLFNYPESVVVYRASSDEPLLVNGSLVPAVQVIIEDYCKDWGLPLQTLTLLDPSPSQQNNNMRRPQKHNKVLQKGELDENQNDSLLSGVSSESLRNSAEERYLENKKLIEDVENYKKFYGEDNIILKPLILLEEVEINLLMDPLGVLDYNTAEAWGVNPSLPICIKISVSDTLYVNTNIPPSLEIWQLEGETKKKFGLKAQLEMIMREFVKEHWPGKKSRPQVNSKPHPKTTTTSKGSNSPLKKKFKGKAQKPKLSEEMKPKEQQSAKWTPSSKPTNKPFQQTVDISHLAQLVNMGFDEDAAFNALTITDDLEQATNLLLENLPLSPSSTLAPKSSLVSKWSTNEPNKQSIQQKDTEVQDIFEDPSKAVLATKYKGVLVVEDHGFLVLLMSYFLGRLPTLNNYCVICDQPHVFAVGNMLKPAVCSRELCCFSFQQLGVGADAADNVAIEAEVVDLLVCMASAAAHSPRCNIIFNPFPLIFDPDNPKKQILSPERPDYALVRQILDHFLSIEQLTQAKDFLHLKAQLTKSHPLAYPLLQWIIASNRAHIVKLHETKHITSMKTQHQYLLLSAPPEKEERFRQLKRSYSSLFAFHGSAIENWHSILRHGLKNATGTKLQLNGAAYGPGIYLSPQASISFGYSFRSWAPGSSNPNRSTKTANNKLLRAQNVHCIALCEVIDLNLKRFGSIWVQPNEDCVVTRFLFVYTENASYNEVYHNSENSKFLAEVKEALNFYNNNRK